MKYTYLLVLFFAVIIPAIYSFHPKLQFSKHFKAFFAANFIVTLVFLVWDNIFISLKVWGFSDSYILGFKIFDIPVEEILFFVLIPFACLFTYHSITKHYKIRWSIKTENIFIISLSFILLLSGIIYADRLYTSVTFISSCMFLLLIKYFFKVKWLPEFFTVYAVLLIPFFIVNGILTGTGPDNPVVWYNNSEIIGIRFFTIPVEDVIYGMELLLMNTFFYQMFSKVNQ